MEKENTPLKDQVILNPNYPNPFNSTTRIELEVRTRTNLKLTIYDLLGEEMRQIYRGITNPGRYDFIWNGKDNHQNQVASGIYFYMINAGKRVIVRRMILIR